MPTKYLRADLLGKAFGGQDVVNTLWYKCDPPMDSPGAAADALVAQLDTTVVPAVLACQTNNYTLEAIQVQAYDPGWISQFSPAQIYPRDVPGGITTHDVNGPAQCMIVNFQLDLSQAETNPGRPAPRRSYLAFGPLGENIIDTTGAIVLENFPAGTINELKDQLANSLVLDGTHAAIAVRVGKHFSQDDLRSNAPITACAIRSQSSFRRSRNK